MEQTVADIISFDYHSIFIHAVAQIQPLAVINMTVLLQAQSGWTITLAILLSILTLGLNITTFIKTRQEAKKARRDKKHDQAMTLISTIRQFNIELRKWADEVIYQMTEAALLCKLNPAKDKDFYSKRHKSIVKLSELIDRGRLFLPNAGKDKYGQEKESAYRGFRHDALTHIKNAYDLLRKTDYKEQGPNLLIKKKIIEEKRNFLSVISEELDPEKFEREIKQRLLALNEEFNSRYPYV